MNNWLNETLRNEYHFVKLLHKSSKSECILYRNKKLNRDIVIHTLNNADIRVYTALKNVVHDNILNVFDAVKCGDKTVVVEEYINGITLAELTETMSPLGVKRVIVQLCSGLSALHSIGIIHRDITLNNIMLTNDGTVKIIDFDIAKLYSSADSTDHDTMGTVGYAPYEQLGLNKTDERTDIFAVGVLANLLLTKKHPSVQMYTKGRLGKMIGRCTVIDPSARFESADDVLAFLQ